MFLVVHGLIHLVGVAKAFGLARLPQLTQPVSPQLGLLWLAAATLFVAAAIALFVWPRWWWAIGAAAIAASTLAIVPSWSDARVGVVANLIALVGVGVGYLASGPPSLRAEYDSDVAALLARTDHTAIADPITDADLVTLPAPVQHYLRRAGVVGRPRVHNFRVSMHGRIRNGQRGRWMPFTAEQYNAVGEPRRLFYMTASMFMIPAQGYHRFVGPSATMRIRAAAIVPVVDVSGPEMDRSETVTLFNDMCVMAPATLIASSIEWEPIDATTVRARFTNAGRTIRADLVFNDGGELIDFRSDDRYLISSDGAAARLARWSTPLAGYRSFGPAHLASAGEGRWHEPEGDYAYIELTIDEVEYNVPRR